MAFIEWAGTSLRRSIPNTFQIVVSPDHPILLMPPDIIVGGEGLLTAIFFVTKNTRWQLLRARLSAARLALSSSARVIAVVYTEKHEIDNKSWNDFDSVFNLRRDFHPIAEYCMSNAIPKTNVLDLKEVKQRHAISSAVASRFTFSQKAIHSDVRKSRWLFDELKELNTSNVSSAVFHRSNSRKEGVVVRGARVTLATEAGARGGDELRKLWIIGLNEKFTLDTGVPYPYLDSVPNVILIDSWPKNRFDPEKPIRAAAFSGWIMARPQSASELDELIGKSQTATRRDQREHS